MFEDEEDCNSNTNEFAMEKNFFNKNFLVTVGGFLEFCYLR
jgi:hypothetical protein